MFSITLKRSAATLGVVAGLLAAAGPASAQIPPTTTGLKAGSAEVLNETVTVRAPASGQGISFTRYVDMTDVFALGTPRANGSDQGILTVEIGIAPLKAPASVGTQIGSEG